MGTSEDLGHCCWKNWGQLFPVSLRLQSCSKAMHRGPSWPRGFNCLRTIIWTSRKGRHKLKVKQRRGNWVYLPGEKCCYWGAGWSPIPLLSRSPCSRYQLWSPPFPCSPLAISSRGQMGRNGDRKLCMWPVNPAGMALQEVVSVSQVNFIPEYRKFVGLGTVAGKSPNLF